MRAAAAPAALAAAALVLLAGQASGAGDPPAGSAKLRGDLAALVAGDAALDPRLRDLVPGLRAGEVPFLALLTAPGDDARRAELEAAGARVLRSYRSTPLVALVGSPVTVLRVAALPSVARLAPVEVVTALADEPVPDQRRGTPADVGAPPLWQAGVTGKGVRIAVIDTGIDPTHPDLDDQDFRHWTSLLNAPKIVDGRDFNGGVCRPLTFVDGHGHGTHVAAIAAGTGEGGPARDDDGRIVGVAPDAEIAVGKALTDAGAGVNSDLIAAMEWAAMPPDASPTGCSVGAQVVNLSLGSEARPNRLNSESDVDLVGLVANRLAVRYGTLFVAAAGNSGPFEGSVLEAPGAASQVLSVGATAKDWDVIHDDTLSGEPCAGWAHDPSPPDAVAHPCGDRFAGTTGPASLSSLSSRGPSAEWLRPDVVAPGYNIVSAQAAAGTAIASQDVNPGTRADPLYATASGTSMATPAASGASALLLSSYRGRFGTWPSGSSGTAAPDRAPAYALVRAALMNTATTDLLEARVIGFGDIFPVVAYEPRNIRDDPYVGPFGEGAGKIDVGRASSALTSGLVAYSAGPAAGADAGPRDFQGTWQAGAVAPGTSSVQRFVLQAAPRSGPFAVSFSLWPGRPSDGMRVLPSSWVRLPGGLTVQAGGSATVDFRLSVPATAGPGAYGATVLVRLSSGTILHLPVLVTVPLHDADTAAGSVGAQGAYASDRDVFGKTDTIWPSVLGAANGAGADWTVFPVDLAADLGEVVVSAWDTTGAADETYDLYLYDSRLDLVASTHPFTSDRSGVTDATAARTPSSESAPALLRVATPAGGRHYLAVNRAHVVDDPPGYPTQSVGSFALRLDEVRAPAEPVVATLTYDGDVAFVQGRPGVLAAHLRNAAGAGVAGRTVSFALDGEAACCSAPTDYAGLAQAPLDPAGLTAGVHELVATFEGDTHWQPASVSQLVLVLGADGGPSAGGGGKVTGGGWFKPGQGGKVELVASAKGAAAPTGHFRLRDRDASVDVSLDAYSALVVSGSTATLTGTVRFADGRPNASFVLELKDGGEPGKAHDTVRFRLPASGYDRSGTLGGGNFQIDA